MITRQKYINGDSSKLHRKYYAQFVNDEVKNKVLSVFSLETLKKSFAKDEYFNDNLTPMKKWDLMGGFAFSNTTGEMTLRPTTSLPIDKNLLDEAKEGYSSSIAVCIYKEAARQLIEV